MITIVCMVWEPDSKYLEKFVEHHAAIGVKEIIFILDEYSLPYKKPLPRCQCMNIKKISGKSKRTLLSQREKDNYQDCLTLVQTEYVVFLDADEFMHQDTLLMLNQHRPQSMELPWMMMCISKHPKINNKGENLYRGILVPQRKTISRTRDIIKPGVHRSLLKGNGKMINYAECKKIPIYHYYVRNNADIEEKNHSSFEIIERRAGIDLIFQALCENFAEEEHYIKLTEQQSAEIEGEAFCIKAKYMQRESLKYLSIYYKILFRYTMLLALISKLLNININYSVIEGPRAALKRIKVINKLRYTPLKILYIAFIVTKNIPTKKDGG